MSDLYKKGPPKIKCPECSQVANRVGAQDACDVYVCPDNHLTRVKVGTRKYELDTEGS